MYLEFYEPRVMDGKSGSWETLKALIKLLVHVFLHLSGTAFKNLIRFQSETIITKCLKSTYWRRLEKLTFASI
jgi:hypothetical protein